MRPAPSAEAAGSAIPTLGLKQMLTFRSVYWYLRRAGWPFKRWVGIPKQFVGQSKPFDLSYLLGTLRAGRGIGMVLVQLQKPHIECVPIPPRETPAVLLL